MIFRRPISQLTNAWPASTNILTNFFVPFVSDTRIVLALKPDMLPMWMNFNLSNFHWFSAAVAGDSFRARLLAKLFGEINPKFYPLNKPNNNSAQKKIRHSDLLRRLGCLDHRGSFLSRCGRFFKVFEKNT